MTISKLLYKTLLISSCFSFGLMTQCTSDEAVVETPVTATNQETQPETPATFDEAATTAASQQFEPENVHFDFDQYYIKDTDKTALRTLADHLKSSNQVVVIAGHCDERGANQYNLALGYRRANSIKKFLEVMGIPEAQLRTVSYGKERPADPRHTEDAWARNRRAEFSFDESPSL